MKTTVARGIKTPIIRPGDNLAKIVVSSILNSSRESNYTLNDRDVVGITESVVSISMNNYVTIDHIKDDINIKFPSDTLGIVFPILSRNRFSIILKAFAKAKKELFILLKYPQDEVGNPILDINLLNDLNINPYSDVLTEDDYNKYFGNFIHPYTDVNMVNYYREVCTEVGNKVTFIFSNNPEEILKYTNNVLVSDIHTRFETYDRIIKFSNNDLIIYRLDQIMNSPINKSGYNSKFGLLGSNTASINSVKLFPNDSTDLLYEIQDLLFEETGKTLEVMIYGDGAFRDPVSKIWELADPVVSPSYTSGLIGSPNEVKLKYLVDNKYSHLKGEELEEAIRDEIMNKEKTSLDSKLGTTPRNYVDLLGSLCDLVSGSGDKGTPVILIQNYF